MPTTERDNVTNAYIYIEREIDMCTVSKTNESNHQNNNNTHNDVHHIYIYIFLDMILFIFVIWNRIFQSVYTIGLLGQEGIIARVI